MLSYLPLITDPLPTGLGSLQLPFLTDRLSNHFSDLCRRHLDIPMHSYLDTASYETPQAITSFILDEIQRKMLYRNRQVPCQLRSPCFFQIYSYNLPTAQIERKFPLFHIQHDLSFPTKDEIESRLSQLPLTEDDIYDRQFDSNVTIHAPTPANPQNAATFQLVTDCRAILINLINTEKIYDLLQIPQYARLSPAPEHLILNILNDYKIFQTMVFPNDHSPYPNLECTRSYVGKAYGQTIGVNRPDSYTVTDMATDSSSILFRLLRLGIRQYNSQYPSDLRYAFGPILPKYATTYTTFTFLNLICYLAEYIYEDSLLYLQIPRPPPASQARFLMSYPLLNPHSLRLYDYLQSLRFPEDMQIPHAFRFLIDCATSGRYQTWTKFQRSPIDIRVNNRTFKNYTVSTASYFDKVIVYPTDCSQQESIVIHRLGRSAPGYEQFSSQTENESISDDDPIDYEVPTPEHYEY